MPQPRDLRRWLRSLEPRVLGMLRGPLLSRWAPWVDSHNLLSFGRKPLARGVAIGMFCGLIPGPLQVLGTLGLCSWLRGNVVAGVVATFYTNPLTILPLYAVAFYIGQWVLPGTYAMPPMPDVSWGDAAMLTELSKWVGALGWPLVIGIPVLALNLAALAYALVNVWWLAPIVRRARQMARRARQVQQPDQTSNAPTDKK